MLIQHAKAVPITLHSPDRRQAVDRDVQRWTAVHSGAQLRTAAERALLQGADAELRVPSLETRRATRTRSGAPQKRNRGPSGTQGSFGSIPNFVILLRNVLRWIPSAEAERPILPS